MMKAYAYKYWDRPGNVMPRVYVPERFVVDYQPIAGNPIRIGYIDTQESSLCQAAEDVKHKSKFQVREFDIPDNLVFRLQLLSERRKGSDALSDECGSGLYDILSKSICM